MTKILNSISQSLDGIGKHAEALVADTAQEPAHPCGLMIVVDLGSQPVAEFAEADWAGVILCSQHGIEIGQGDAVSSGIYSLKPRTDCIDVGNFLGSSLAGLTEMVVSIERMLGCPELVNRFGGITIAAILLGRLRDFVFSSLGKLGSVLANVFSIARLAVVKESVLGLLGLGEFADRKHQFTLRTLSLLDHVIQYNLSTGQLQGAF